VASTSPDGETAIAFPQVWSHAFGEVSPMHVGSEPEMSDGDVHVAPPSWLTCATIGAVRRMKCGPNS
jgi:hypothetical protein